MGVGVWGVGVGVLDSFNRERLSAPSNGHWPLRNSSGYEKYIRQKINHHRFFQALDIAQPNKQKKISGLVLHLIFHRFSPFNYCLGVVLWLKKEDYPKNSHVVSCPSKQRYFESFMWLDLV